MALTYPLSLPDSIGIAQIELRAANAVSTSQSPFTFKQQVFRHQGQRWEASVSIPSVRKDLAADWKAFLVGLNGQQGTFLLGDPDYPLPRGTARSCTGTGTIGSSTLSVSMVGTLLAGDYINLGGVNSANAKLYMVLEDLSGSGSLKIWPNLRASTSPGGDPVYLQNPTGVFRLRDNVSSWQIGPSSAYGISFECVEALT